MTMKYLLKTALCLLLCALLSLPALAKEGEELTCGDYIYVLLEDGGARITGYYGEDAELTIPAELDGHAVREIGEEAFRDCDLTTVTLPEGLTSIGDSAFYFCNSLTAVTLPDSLTSIGANPFSRCDSLAKIDVSPDHPVFAQIDGVLYEKATKTLICYPAGKAGDTFAVPDGILAIGDDAFYRCVSLTTVTLPDSLTTIGDSAFSFCESLTTVTLPDSLTTIGDHAFSNCESLTTITLPESLTSTGDYAFSRCYALTTVTLPEGLTSIGEGAFAFCEALTSVTLPDGLTSIGDSAFSNCDALTLTVPRDSYACQYAIDNGLTYIYPDANAWLNA